MKLHQFKTYDDYIKAQCRGSRRRANRRAGIDSREVAMIAERIQSRGITVPDFVLCHGARCGTEIDMFRCYFPGVRIVGTDLAPCREAVIEWDFQKPNPEWTGRCDVVYSNSLDHASNPQECIRVWLDQLRPLGLLFVTWCTNSMLPMEGSGPCAGGDCFGASLHEYIRLLEEAGVVYSLLYIGRSRSKQRGTRVTIVAGREHK